MEIAVKYPIGEQDFRSLREMGYLYVDKTKYIETILEGGKYYFLARPRRFGKSLFLSTLQYFFEGKRELFKGLYANGINWEWTAYPVLRLDLNTDKFADLDVLDDVLDNAFRRWENKYGVDAIKNIPLSQRFKNIIETAHETTGQPVVILVDEYDKPLVGNLNKKVNFELYRTKLASLYTNFKSSAEHIRLVFLTGVSRFGKLSVFSDLNNLNDITFDNDFADICGITENELLTNCSNGVAQLAATLELTYEEACYELKKNYDGYRFAKTGNDIYNPWSLLNCLSKRDIQNYWNDTGVPSVVAETLKKIDADLEKTFNCWVGESDLKGLDLLDPNPTALLYQTGYLTIKSYNRRLNKYRLGIPNKEVKEGLLNYMLPLYAKMRRGNVRDTVGDMMNSLILGNPEEFMLSLQTYFAGVSYKMKMDNENNFHNAFFLLMDLIGIDAETEVATSYGSIDLVLKTDDYIYIIELKYDSSAHKALDQIEEKLYARPYRTDHRKLFKIGANFSSKTRTIEEWEITM